MVTKYDASDSGWEPGLGMACCKGNMVKFENWILKQVS